MTEDLLEEWEHDERDDSFFLGVYSFGHLPEWTKRRLRPSRRRRRRRRRRPSRRRRRRPSRRRRRLPVMFLLPVCPADYSICNRCGHHKNDVAAADDCHCPGFGVWVESARTVGGGIHGSQRHRAHHPGRFFWTRRWLHRQCQIGKCTRPSTRLASSRSTTMQDCWHPIDPHAIIELVHD
jgi:hypothetical protein